ncbi:RNA cytidine acetyltransferase [Macrosteles quadrilineatus]|uniref:RNA cytidine acetyltransferase n=1 Tax=Macrosteles quadrilineatus TaxID=74068 RepID=UPI0023E1E598|nr:RNA cytidine acetyltransferase [Macrosteles quadrilineatus]
MSKTSMVRKKIDNRIRVLIENGVTLGHRTMFVVVGDKGKDQVVILHHMLSKATVKARPSVLWCYKKELGFSSNRKKRMKQLQKKVKTGKLNVNEDDPFELFVASTNIRYCYYAETQKILGNTYGMCVLQDFEALQPNLLARTIETVEGGGIVVLLLRSVSSLKQLYTMSMDVHERYRTEAHKEVVARFNERFLLSLSSCDRCLVVDDQLTVLPISSHVLDLEPVTREDVDTQSSQELATLKESLRDTQPVSALLNCCKTLDQGKAVLKFIEAISEKTLRSTVSLTAARGRGKSAALGLSVAAAVAFGYANIFVTSPSPENLKTFFEFVFKGFDALAYQEHLDYSLVQSTNPEYNKALVRVNIFRDHRQTIQYIAPTDAHYLSQAELLVIDEAAAIPLPFVKAMLGPYLVFLASTINGYEGTGRSLSLKLLQQLRTQAAPVGSAAMKAKDQSAATGRCLHEIVLEEPIRYRPGDSVEKWLTDLLCLDATSVRLLQSGTPPPDLCDLYYINRDTLFCYHKASEEFLHRIVSLFVSSHYKNSPNDLQMMSDAPAHHLFCLLGPIPADSTTLPEVLCVIQVCLEGQVSRSSVSQGLSQGKRASGDLIPWTVAQQYQDQDFPSLAGARVVRIATHPDYQSMGYGTRALNLLKDYYELKITSLDESELPSEHIDSVQDEDVGLLEETIEPRKSLPPLLLKLSERPPERLDYLGVSYGLTTPLLKFWKRAGFVPVYLRQTTNELTGEHSCIMLSTLQQSPAQWLAEYWQDFRRRFVSLLAFQFRTFPTSLALSVIVNKAVSVTQKSLTKPEMDVLLTKYDIKRLEMYCNNLVDYHLVVDLLPTLARLYFLNKMGDVHLSAVQAALLLGMGLQHKVVDSLATELELPASQLLGLFNRSQRRMVSFLVSLLESSVAETMTTAPAGTVERLNPVQESLSHELDSAAQELKKKQDEELKKLKKQNLSQYAIKGSEAEWDKALSKGSKNLISVKSGVKRPLPSEEPVEDPEPPQDYKKKKKKKNKNKNSLLS